jgi:hypothetical protein
MVMNKAVLVGINQYASQPPLAGCVNDVADIRKALLTHAAVAHDRIEILTDARSTKANVLRALREMVVALEPGDSGYFHYSGYGARMRSVCNGAPDGLGDVLCPHEFNWSVETSINNQEVRRVLGMLRLGARLVFSFDCGYSGVMARVATPHGQPRSLAPPLHLRAARVGVRPGFRAAACAVGVSFLAACSPSQMAVDTSFNGRPNGAFTYYFLKELDAAVKEQSISTTIDAIEPPLHYLGMTPRRDNGEDAYFPASSSRVPSSTPATTQRSHRG